MIAIKSKARVVPTRIFGAFEAYGRAQTLPLLGIPIHVAYGKPLDNDALDTGEANPDRYLEASKRIMQAIESIRAPKNLII